MSYSTLLLSGELLKDWRRLSLLTFTPSSDWQRWRRMVLWVPFLLKIDSVQT